MAWCLPLKEVESFKKAILSGRIDPERLAEMSSKERRELFAKELGEVNAESINAEFESKLLLKNRQAGYVNWARRVLGEKSVAGRDVISRVQRMDKVLDAADEQVFLEDLVAKRLGTQVSYNEAKQIADLSKKIDTTKAAMEKGGDRLDYGRSVVGLRNYVSDLKNEANKFRLGDLKNPGKALAKGLETTAGVAKSIKASLDNSAIFRQGWKTLWTNPVIWKRNAVKTFSDMAKQFGGKNVLDEVDADIISRPNFDLMKKAKLDVGALEEAYPSRFPEKIPGLGRLYKASEAAYTGFVRRTRADVFDKMIDIAKKSDVELNDQELQSTGKLVNSLTGRGHLGRAEPAANLVNNVFFSPRFLKSQIDTLTQPVTGAGGSNFVRKQASLNLLKSMAGTAAVLAIAKAVSPDSVDFDPRSADFGKIRVGDTRFDVTGGMASLATLAARLATMSSKSSITGRVTELNARDDEGKLKYDARTGKDVIYDFFENKLSPASSVVRDVLKGEDRQGNKPTVLGELQNLFEPLPITNYRELKNNPNSAPTLLALIADGLGISTNTYSAKPSTIFPQKTRARDEVNRLDLDIKGAVKHPDESPEDFKKRQAIQNGNIRTQIENVVALPDYDKVSDEDKKKWLKQAASFASQQTIESLPEKPEKKEERQFPMPQASGFERAYPADSLAKFERMNAQQRARVADSMAQKAWLLTHSSALSDEEKEGYKARLEKLGITPRPAGERPRTTTFRQQLSAQ